MTDLTEAVILPPLFQRLRRLAPTVIIESFLSKRRETTKELAAGRLDFAVDAPLNTDPQVRHVKLMEDRYVCAMRKGHPLAGKEKLTLDDYLSLTHIHISSRRSGLGYVDLALGKMGIQRKIALRSQHYLMASQVLQQTDMVMTVPERFARRNDCMRSTCRSTTCRRWKLTCTGTKAPTRTRPTVGCASRSSSCASRWRRRRRSSIRCKAGYRVFELARAAPQLTRSI
jgi:DNA-binding transcriptional LysR family regulator